MQMPMTFGFRPPHAFAASLAQGLAFNAAEATHANVKNASSGYEMMPMWPVLDHRDVHNFIDVLHLWHMNLSSQEPEYNLVVRSAHPSKRPRNQPGLKLK